MEPQADTPSAPDSTVNAVAPAGDKSVSLAERYRALRRASDPRPTLKSRVARGAKSALYLFGEIPEKGLSLRQVTLLKWIIVVLLCALFHFIGFTSAREITAWEFVQKVNRAEDRARVSLREAGEILYRRTLRQYEADAMHVADLWFSQHGGWHRPSEKEEPPELIAREEYRRALDDLSSSGLLDAQRLQMQQARTEWLDTKTPEQAWRAFADSPLENLLPLYWYARAHPRMVPYVIEQRLPLEGEDFELAQQFLAWYLPYMDEFDRAALLRSRITVHYNPAALLRKDDGRIFVMITPRPKLRRLGGSLTFDVESKDCLIEYEGKVLSKLSLYDRRSDLISLRPAVFDPPPQAPLTVRVQCRLNYEERRGSKRIEFSESVHFSHVLCITPPPEPPAQAPSSPSAPATPITRLENLEARLEE